MNATKRNTASARTPRLTLLASALLALLGSGAAAAQATPPIPAPELARLLPAQAAPSSEKGTNPSRESEEEDTVDEDETPSIVRQPDGAFLADARAQLEDVVATVGPEFDIGDVADEVDTLAGYVMTRAGRLPSRGEVVSGPGDFEIEVLDSDPRRLKKLRITRSSGRPERARRTGRRRDADAAVITPAPPSQPEPPSGKETP